MYIHAYSIMNTNSRVQSVVLSDVYCTYMPPYPVVTTVASSVYVRMTYVCVCMYVLYIGVLKMMQARIETLRSTLDRVTARVSEPHAKIVSRTRQLSRLQVRTYVASVGCTTSSFALYCTTSSALCVCMCASCVVHFIHLCSLRVTYCARSFECCTS